MIHLGLFILLLGILYAEYKVSKQIPKNTISLVLLLVGMTIAVMGMLFSIFEILIALR